MDTGRGEYSIFTFEEPERTKEYQSWKESILDEVHREVPQFEFLEDVNFMW